MISKKHESEEHGGHEGGGGHGGGGHHGHGGGGHDGEHEGAPEWLISFADNVTLMMGFFVILLAMNLKPDSGGGAGGAKQGGGGAPSPEALDMAIAVRAAFNNPVDMTSTNPEDLVLIQHLMRRAAEGQALSPGLKGMEQDVESIRPGKYYTLGGRITFDEGSEELNGAAREAALDLGKRFHGTRYIVEVRGHASTAEAVRHPDRGLSFSYRRALEVAEELVAGGVVWGQIRIIACGDNDHYGASPSEEGAQRADQRVEVIVRGDLLPDDVNISPAAPSPETP